MNSYTVWLLETDELHLGYREITASKFVLENGYFCFYDMGANLVAMYNEKYVVGVDKEDGE